MSEVGKYVFGKHEDFDLEGSSPLSTIGEGVFKLRKYDIFYSQKYESAMLVIETADGEQFYSLSEIITDRFVKAVNLGMKLKGALLVFREIEGANGMYHRLEQPTVEEVNFYNKEQFELNQKKSVAKKEKDFKEFNENADEKEE